MANIVNTFRLILILSAVYSLGMTNFTHTLPTDTLTFVNPFTELSNKLTLNNISQQLQTSVEQETNIPLIEVGALIFFSGNIFLDLILNFAFAIPQMIGIILSGLTLIGLNIDNGIMITLQLTITTIISVLYFLGVLELILNVRSGRQIAS